MWNVLNLKVFVTGFRPLAIINGKTAVDSVGCPRFCPHSLFISSPQHELYDLHILPLTVTNQQNGWGWDLLFQAINIWSSHPIKYIPPAYCFPWILKYTYGMQWRLGLVPPTRENPTQQSCKAQCELLRCWIFTQTGKLCLRAAVTTSLVSARSL